MADEIKKVLPVTSQTDDASKTAPSDDDPFADVKKEMATRFSLLPEDIQNTITGSEYQMKLYELAKERKLTYEALGTLELETTMVLLGMTKPEDFRDELQIELKMNDADIDGLVAALNDRVFAPIRQSIQKVYEARKEPESYLSDEKTVAPAAATPAPVRMTPQQQAQSSVLQSNEKAVLERSGVVLNETKPAAPEIVQQKTDRSDILKKIENPSSVVTAPPSGNIIANKLGGTFSVPKKETDYSMKKSETPGAISTPPATKPAADPYREQV